MVRLDAMLGCSNPVVGLAMLGTSACICHSGALCRVQTCCICYSQEVGIHPLVPAETLQSTPLDNAVALLPLAEVASVNGAGVELPSCSTRMAVTVDGTESDEQIAALKVRVQLSCRWCDGCACGAARVSGHT